MFFARRSSVFSAALAAALVVVSKAQDGEAAGDCVASKECRSGNQIGLRSGVVDMMTCQEICLNLGGDLDCTHFTFRETSGICALFNGCELGEEDCDGCRTGDAACLHAVAMTDFVQEPGSRRVSVRMTVISSATGEPVPDARVEAWATPELRGCPFSVCRIHGLTDVDGVAEVSFPEGAASSLAVAAEHWLHMPLYHAGVRVDMPEGEFTAEAPFPIVLANTRFVNLTLRVVDSLGTPAHGAEVEAGVNFHVDDNLQLWRTTDQLGVVHFALPTPALAEDNYVVQFYVYLENLSGYGTHLVEAEGEDDVVEIGLDGVLASPTVVLRVRTTTRSFEPVEGVRVVTDHPLAEDETGEEFFTGADGEVAINLRRQPGYNSGTVRASLAGHISLSSGYFSYNPSAGETFVHMFMTRFDSACPDFDGSVVDRIVWSAPGAPDDFELQLQHRSDDFSCTQTVRHPTCGDEYANVTDVGDEQVRSHSAVLVPGQFHDGYVHVEVYDRPSFRIDEYPNATVTAYGEDGSSFELAMPGGHNRADQWSVGCLDMNSHRFYCTNVLELGDRCLTVLEGGDAATATSTTTTAAVP